ncbi:MAG: hypothetical protein U1F34_03135 [Gammaproteobacteria bacterium]
MARNRWCYVRIKVMGGRMAAGLKKSEWRYKFDGSSQRAGDGREAW